MVKKITVVIVFAFSALAYAQDSTGCHKYAFSIQGETDYYSNIVNSTCENDFASVWLNNPSKRTSFYLSRFREYTVTEMEIFDEISREFPEQICQFESLRNLDVHFGKVKSFSQIKLSNLVNLKHLGLHSRISVVPNDIFYLKELKSLAITSTKNLRIKVPADYTFQLEELFTDVCLSKNNVDELLKLKQLKKLTIMEVKSVKEYYSLLKDIETLEIWGKLNNKEQDELKKLLPNSVFKEQI